LAQDLVVAVGRNAAAGTDWPVCGQGSGTPGVAPAAALLGLAQVSPAELLALPGLGPSKAARVVAGLELGRRLGQARVERGTLGAPSDVFELLGDRMRHLDREHFIVLLLDTKNHLLGSELVSVGSLDASIVHPREVFKAAVRRSASGVILAHNHPSGDPSPSEADLRSTRRLEEAGRVLGIPVLDHVIIGDGRFVSLRQSGLAGDAPG
jgi:DNA repair protein RadC